ncbi:unnamed protein product [Parnassius apollo]|uniref:(apollo) hypothetical protein n=1 Tax=Parnassius apollo TaxID=110799 RepID=A0A8S3XBM6_PARAO|nr:unnamed protein product [Parnassius apollo]
MVEEAAPVIICEVKNSYHSDGYLLSSLGEEEVKSSDYKIDDNEPDKNPLTESENMLTTELPTQVTNNTDDNEPDKNHLTESENMLTTELPTQVTNNTATHDQYNILFSQTDCVPRKTADYVKRVGVLRLKKLEVKKTTGGKIIKFKVGYPRNKKNRLQT